MFCWQKTTQYIWVIITVLKIASPIMLWLYFPSCNIPSHWSNHSDEMIRCCESEVFSLSFHRHHLHSPTSELSLRNWYKISAQGCTRKYIFGRYQIQIISVGLIISSIVKSKPKSFWGHALPALQSIIHNMDYNNIIDDSNSHIKRRKNLVSFVNLDALNGWALGRTNLDPVNSFPLPLLITFTFIYLHSFLSI